MSLRRPVRSRLPLLFLLILTTASPAAAHDPTDPPTDPLAQRAAVLALPLHVRPVFDTDELPGVGMAAPEAVEAAVGPHTYAVSYVDNDYRPVTDAKLPGRYAAIVTVTPDDSPPITQVVTLFRAPGPVDRRTAIDVQHVTLPDGYGFPADPLDPRADELNEAIARQATRWLLFDPDGAELLAALHEADARDGDTPPEDAMLTKHRVTTEADAWRFGLEKHLGLVEHRYLAHLPADYHDDPDRHWPLVVFLHGAGERGYDLNKVTYNGPPKHARAGKDFPFLIVSPQCEPGSWWSIAQVHDLIDEAMATYRVDPDRVYLTGLSMGGYGTWSAAAARPDRFAAIAPVCGGGSTHDAPVLANVPTWAFHGDADGVVPVTQSTRMADAITAVDGALFKLTIYEGVGHNAWDPAYEDDRLYDWLLSNKRGQPAAPPTE